MRFYDIRMKKSLFEMEGCDNEEEFYRPSNSLYDMPDRHQMLFEEFDKKCCVALYTPEGQRNEALGAIAILYDNAFKQSDDDVRDYMCEAMDIWGVRHVKQFRENMTVRECEALYATNNMHYASLQRNSIYGRTNLLELRCVLAYWGNRKQLPLMVENRVSKAFERNDAEAAAFSTRYSKSLGEELARIYDKGPQAAPASAIPVHYILEGVNPARYEPALEVLLGALAHEGRLPSPHIFHMNICRSTIYWNERVDCDEWLNARLFESLRGNILVLQYGEDDSESDFSQSSYGAFVEIIDQLREFAHDIQVVFLVPPGSKNLQRRIRSRFMAPLCAISEDEVSARGSYTKRLKRLEDMAGAQGLEPDEALGAVLDRHMRNLTESSLEEIFAEWRSLRQAKASFPAYSGPIDEYATKPKISGDSLSARERLHKLIGLEGPKRLIDEMIDRFRMNRRLEELGEPVRPFTMHCSFYGSPGTGKTEVARLYGEMLRDAGILREGRVIEVSGAEGFSVDEAFRAAKGSVLFVDEAYAMAGIVGSSMVADFIAHMENCREDTVVILAGYKDAMEGLYKVNKGFKSRIGFEIEFPDYTEEQLFQIFQLYANGAGVRLDDDAKSLVRERLAAAGRMEDQGNARYVRKLFEDAVGMQQIRLAREAGEDGVENAVFDKDERRLITAEDVKAVPGAPEPHGKTALEELACLIGLEKVKGVLERQIDFACIRKERRDRGLKCEHVPMHMAFLGNPGTGKTEVARLVARAYKEAGILSVGELFECGRQDIIGEHVGETAPKVKQLFRKARGSVIFIDEAYSLLDEGYCGYSDEAISTMISEMENLRDEVVVIFAGYTKDIERLLDSNPGFSSRVKTRVDFDDYSVDELVSILRFMAKKQGMKLGRGALAKAKQAIQVASTGANFGNARYVRNLLEDAMLEQAYRLKKVAPYGELSDRQLTTLVASDFKVPETRQHASIGFAA